MILKNEQKHDEMVEILDHLQQYVPSVTTTEKVHAPGLSEPAEIFVDKFHHLALGRLLVYLTAVDSNSYHSVLFCLTGGDQLTAARTRSSQRIRCNSVRGKDRLEGVVAVVEDWHAKVCLLGVCSV